MYESAIVCCFDEAKCTCCVLILKTFLKNYLLIIGYTNKIK